jgi:U3 small nucleolar RNA-associated protein 3
LAGQKLSELYNRLLNSSISLRHHPKITTQTSIFNKMGKKRKSRNPEGPTGPREVDSDDARLGAIRSWKDVADSEDEYWMNAEEIDLEDRPESKRQKRAREEEAFFEHSDQEVLGLDHDESDSDSDSASRQTKNKGKKGSDDELGHEGQDDEEGDDKQWWGSSKKDYYNADKVVTEEDAKEEEAEAKRLQKEKLSKMAEEDFVFDGDEWLEQEKDDIDKVNSRNVITETLDEAEIPEDLNPEERYELLKVRYPEFEPLVAEFQSLQPRLVELQKEAEGKSGKSVAAIRYWVLGCYVAALASYFAILTSPSRDAGVEGVQRTMRPAELRDHEVMEMLISCREAWDKVKNMKVVTHKSPTEPIMPETVDINALDENVDVGMAEVEATLLKSAKKKAKALENAKEAEDDLADLDNLPLTSKKSKKKKAKAQTKEHEGDSDFGEEESLDPKTAAEKAKRQKSLRFYTSQIVQTANKRANAGRDAGGDMDVPYRERLKDRQARLNAEAERRGRKDSKQGAALGDDSSDDDEVAASIRNKGDEEYYDMVASSVARKNAGKADRYAAYAEARKGELIVEQEEIGEDGKRKITYAIEKNKGLTAKRKKENRNPRVKKRLMYDKKMKKLSSMKAVYKGPPKGGYHGVETGIKAGLIKSVKF